MTENTTTAHRSGPMAKFVLTTLVGAFFFLVPVYVGGWTIPFDVAVSYITDGFPGAVALYCLVVILASAALSILAEFQVREKVGIERFDVRYFKTGPTFLGFRILGGVFAAMIFFGVGPQAILADSTGGLMFGTLVASVAVIVPIGAVFITLFTAFGGLEFVGTLARPVMRPLFKVPGRAALDAIASYVGSYSIGLYVTNKMYNESRYSAREAAIVATCFSTVSMGFFAVVAATLDLLPYFPLIFLSTSLVTMILAVILCRIPPLSLNRDEYVGEPVYEKHYSGNLFRHAVDEAVERSSQSRGVLVELKEGFVDGVKLTLVILPTILAIGLLAILLAENTPVFAWLGTPIEPLLALLGLPDAEIIAPATLI
ncbi:MAG: YjiH family protein, partial [Rubrobacteraceae bacterium]